MSYGMGLLLLPLNEVTRELLPSVLISKMAITNRCRPHRYRAGQSWFTVMSTRNTEFILTLVFINYCIIFHTNNCEAAFVPPCMEDSISLKSVKGS